MAAHRHPRPAPRSLGITLVELLIALLVLSIVLVLAGGGIVQALRVQSVNEAATSMQGKLRRITEVVSQDLRSSVLGAVTNTPIASADNAISFALARGGQGYQVVSTTNGQVGIAAQETTAAALGLEGRRVLLVNRLGDGITFTLPSSPSLSGNTWTFGHACGATMVPFDPPVRLFAIDALGYELVDGDLMRQVAGEAALPVAFGLAGFEIEYLYRIPGAATVDVASAGPARAGGLPLMVRGDGAVMEALRVRVTAEERVAGNRTVERSYVTQIALPDSGVVDLRSVVNCQ